MKKYTNLCLLVAAGSLATACNSGSGSSTSSTNQLNSSGNSLTATAVAHPFPQSAKITYKLSDGTTAIYPAARKDSDV